MPRQGRVSAGIVIWRQNSGAIAVEWAGEIAVFYACFTGAMVVFNGAVTTKSPEDGISKMVASKQNKSEKILSIFLTKIPIPAAASVLSITPIWAYFYACFVFRTPKIHCHGFSRIKPCLFLATRPKFSIN